jgi:hypothetical protein
MQYRNIRIQDLSADAVGQNPTGAFEVSSAGSHTVEFRSVDAAGNREAKQMVSFEIGRVAPPGPTDPIPTPTPQPPAGGPDPVVDPPGSFKIGRLATRLGKSTFARQGVRVPVMCDGGMAGTAKLSVSRKVARQLKLGRTTLQSVAVRCFGQHSAGVRLKPSKALMRKLTTGKKGPRTVKLQVQLRLQEAGRAAKTVTRTVTLRRR